MLRKMFGCVFGLSLFLVTDAQMALTVTPNGYCIGSDLILTCTYTGTVGVDAVEWTLGSSSSFSLIEGSNAGTCDVFTAPDASYPVSRMQYTKCDIAGKTFELTLTNADDTDDKDKWQCTVSLSTGAASPTAAEVTLSVSDCATPSPTKKGGLSEAEKVRLGLGLGLGLGIPAVITIIGVVAAYKKRRFCFKNCGNRGGAGGGGAGGGGAGGAGGDGQANGGNGGTTTQPSPDQKAKNRRLPPSSPDSGSQESPRHVSHRPQPPPPSSANPEHPSKPGHVAVVRPQPLPPAGQPQGNLYTRGLSANLEDPKSLVYQTNRLDPLDLKQKREELKDEDEQTEQKKKKKKKKKTLKTETEDKMADEAEDDL